MPGPRTFLDVAYLRDHGLERRRHPLMHDLGVIPLDEEGPVAEANKQTFELSVRDSREHGWVGDLVTVQVQDRQHGTVRCGIQKLVRVPGGRERSGLGFAVADYARNDEAGIVESRTVGMRQSVTKLATLMDRARRLGGRMTANAAGK